MRKDLLLIFILATLLRLIYIAGWVGFNAQPNPHDHWLEQVSRNLASGGGFGSAPGVPTLRKPPLYPAALAAVYTAFGPNRALGRAGQAAGGGLLAMLVYLIATTIQLSRHTALLSGLIMGGYPLHIFLSGWYLTENLYLVLLACAWLYMARIQGSAKIKYLLLCGLFLGGAALTRSKMILIPPFIWLWSQLVFAPNQRRIWQTTLSISSLLLMITFAWTARNYQVSGEFILSATGGGRMFWGANNDRASGDVVLLSGSPRLAMSKDLPQNAAAASNWRAWQGSPWLNVFMENRRGGISDREVDRKYYALGQRWIRENPWAFVKLVPQKIYYLWKFWSPHASYPDLPKELFLPAQIYYYLVLAGAGLGLYYSLAQWRNWAFVYVFLIHANMSAALFFGDARQRISVIPLVILLAAYGYQKLYGYLRQPPTTTLSNQEESA